MSIESPVKALNAEVARKIAAGEVIDRPASIVRELMDNAIDSKADSITVEISGGGIEKIRVVDNGCGMTKEDLINSARPHSTSKIRSENDLLNLSTLGFRGEALASIAAVSRLSITSGGWKMKASITEDHIIEKTPEFSGTIVQSEGLFENIPARRVFLKREATEAILCKNMFTEKAIPQFQKAFKLVVNGQIKMNLPKNQTLKERYLEAREIKENPALFYQVEGKSPDKKDDWTFSIIIGEPGIRRNNKKDIEIFLNGRKIQEYSLVQAIEYGSKGYFPNGTFPVAAAFIQMDPAQVDFNIHPAKKEVKFKDINGLHHGISSTLSAFWQNYTNKTMKSAIKSVNSEPSDLWKSTAFPKYSAGTAERGGISLDTGSQGLSIGPGGTRSTASETSGRAVIGGFSAGKTGSNISQKEEKIDYIREKMQKIIASYNMESEGNESVCNFSNNDKEK
ncbi:MAG: DNA mismatch repair endonuclease MutL, partial [Treponema sp.]|nr:DNA mismatch repair endonuclease MutL [Treponema sp.]